MMVVRTRSLVGMLLLLGAFSPSFALLKTVTIDRRPPISQYCPIDNVDFDLTFVAEQPYVRLTIETLNTPQNLVDNIAVIDKASYDAHVVVPPGFQGCYAAPGDPNAPALDFNASGTPEVYLALFDSSAAGWDLSRSSFQSGSSAPRSPALGTDTTGGALQLGDPNLSASVLAKAAIRIPNLTPGTEYIVTGWWYIEDTAHPLTVTIDTLPCKDPDADGVTDCDGDCGVHDATTRPGAVELCDGVDNDCDGQLDEDPSCDRICDAPQLFKGDARLTTTTHGSTRPSLVWTRSRYIAVFLDAVETLDAFVAQVSSAGAPVGVASPLVVTAFQELAPVAAWSGSELGVASSGLRRFDRDGRPLGDRNASAPGGPDSELVWTGQEYGVIGAANSVGFSRLSPEGTTIAGDVIPGGAPFSTKARVAWNGTRYAAVWQDDWISPKLKFRLIEPTDIATGSIVDVGPAAGTAFGPAIAAGDGTFGIVWQDRRDGPDGEIYFARFSSDGIKLGPDVRVTNAAGGSFDPDIAWSGAEWGIAWDDTRTGSEEIWFARVDATGVKVGSDTRVTNAPGHSRNPSIVWAGGKYGIAYSDDRESINDEVYFTPLGCDCVDGDGDGSSSCVDCADTDASIYPGAPSPCNGVTNLDCNSVYWPLPAPVDDLDGDGFSPCEGDCDDAAPTAWATPGEAPSLVLSHNTSTGVTTLSWATPSSPGGLSLAYDTLRSTDPSDFTVATCVDWNDASDRSATDATATPLGAAYYYLVRGENVCPIGFGIGSVGTDSAGVPRASRLCP